MADKMRFTFSDLIAGYVTNFDAATDSFGMRTTDGREFTVSITDTTYAEVIRNLGEDYQDASGAMRQMLTPGRYLYAYGIFFPEAGDYTFEVKHIVFVGRAADEWCFEAPDWWVHQVKAIGDFYLNAQWPDGTINFDDYRTNITVEGARIMDRLRQETDTISRGIYGWATAYMLTGEDRFLEAAEKGTEYLRDHMRAVDEDADVVYWYHAIDRNGAHERKILASQFGDDYDAIPAYEQIYALAGPTQTWRITGDPRIRSDIDRTLNLFDKYFLDREKGGYFSHVDPITFNPRAESLGKDQSRKNWNSVGDHAPAYLINLLLSSAESAHADFLKYVADIIVDRFPDYENSPFVQEKFFEDWSKDQEWGWQQNRAVVGHNLKIAWNLMRVNSIKPDARYVELARKIAEIVPPIGSDLQRGGWYDVMDREVKPGNEWHRLAWHDRKAWWQQEQAILAYLILAGTERDPEYVKLARESAAFYNAWFLDQDNGGVYFNVLASGVPYLTGTERMKGSHSMSLYHSTELCFLAQVYSNLLVTRTPIDLHFKPKPGAFKDNVLHVCPDLLPPGSVKLDAVWINGQEHSDFNADDLTVNLPSSSSDLRVRVRVAPSVPASTFSSSLDLVGDDARITMSGSLDAEHAYAYKAVVDRAIAAQPKRLVLNMSDLYAITSEGVRVLVFATEHLSVDASIIGVGASESVKDAFRKLEFDDDVIWQGELVLEKA
ncbi:MAG: AGE family epimerase/isomerase [Chloroflexota bacterium]